jgi:ABC-type transport system substrate-binding protein
VDEKALAAMAETNPGKREQLEKEVGAFLMDNYLTDFAYYSMDAVWPVGPRIEEWTEHVRTSDLRQANGYEFIRHRQK